MGEKRHLVRLDSQLFIYWYFYLVYNMFKQDVLIRKIFRMRDLQILARIFPYSKLIFLKKSVLNAEIGKTKTPGFLKSN